MSSKMVLKHIKNNIKKVAEKLYNVFGGKRNEEVEELDAKAIENVISKNRKKDGGLGFRRLYDVKELENSSFSFKK